MLARENFHIIYQQLHGWITYPENNISLLLHNNRVKFDFAVVYNNNYNETSTLEKEPCFDKFWKTVNDISPMFLRTSMAALHTQQKVRDSYIS